MGDRIDLATLAQEHLHEMARQLHKSTKEIAALTAVCTSLQNDIARAQQAQSHTAAIDGLALYDVGDDHGATHPGATNATGSQHRINISTQIDKSALQSLMLLKPQRPPCFDLSQWRAQALYNDVVSRYSLPATAALGCLLLPYLFPELSAFATVEDLVSHLCASDARYRAALPAEFLYWNLPYFIVTRLPDSLRSVKDHVLSLDPTSLTADLLEQHLLAAETSAVAVGASRGTPRTPFFEGCFPSPLAPSYASAAAVDVLSTEDVGAASASAKRRSSNGKGGRGDGGGSRSGGGRSSGGSGGSGGGGGSGGVGGGGGCSGGSGGSGSGDSGGGRTGAQRGGSGGGQRQRHVSCPDVIRTGDHAGQTCEKAHTQHRCLSHLDDAWRTEFGDEVERPHWAELIRSAVAILDLDYDAILSAMYALSASAEGECYRCVPPDPGIVAAALGASESVLPGTAPAKALHTFTLDSGASRCFFRDSTTLTPLPAPVLVRLSSRVRRTDALQDAMVTTTTPGGQRVSICTCTRMGRHLATFTRRPGSSLYTVATEPPQVAASAQVSASGQVAPPCSCRLLSHQTLLWHHRLGHPSMPRLRGMQTLVFPGLCLPCLPHLPRPAFLASRGGSAPHLTPPVRLQLCERFRADIPVLRLHSDRGVRCASAQPLASCLLAGDLADTALDGDVTFDESVPFYHLFPYRSAPPPPPPLFLAPGPPPVDPLPPQGPAPSGVSQVYPLPGTVPVEEAVGSSAARGAVAGGAASGGAEPGVAESEGAGSGGAERGGEEPRGSELAGVEPGGSETENVETGGAESEGAESGGAEPQGAALSGGRAGALPGLSPQQLREWLVRRARLRSGAPRARGTGAAGAGGTGVTTGAGGTRGTTATGPGGARTRGTGAAGTGGVAGARDPTEPGAAGAGGSIARGAGAGGAGVLGVPSSTSLTPPLLCPLPDQTQQPLQPTSPLPAPSPYTEQSGGLTERRELASRPVSPVHTSRHVPRSRPPPVPGTHAMALRPSSVPLRVPLRAPPESSLPAVPDPASDRARATGSLAMGALVAIVVAAMGVGVAVVAAVGVVAAAVAAVEQRGPAVPRLLATAVSDPSFESAAASALVVELLDFAAACHLDYATALVAEFASTSPPSVGGECALGTDVLEDRHEDFECLAAAVPRFASMLLAPEGDPDAPDISTPRSYAEAITAARFSAAFKVRYVARGFSQRQGVDYFHTFSPTPKMTTLRVLLHVAAQRDYELHSLDFSTAFLKGNLHEEIWLRRPPGFIGSFPAGTQWSLRRPVCGLRQAPREWNDTLRTTLAALGFAPSTADPSLFLRTDTLLPPFYVLMYVDDLVFATADTKALTLVKSELQKRHTCTDLGELRNALGLQITRDRARRTITLTQSHMVHQVLQHFGFQFSSPQPTPLSTGHALSAPPSNEVVEPSGPYPELVGCLMYLMTCTRPDLAFPLSLLARYVAPGRHQKVHWDDAKRVLRYLCSTLGMGLVLGGRGPVVLSGHADASWVDDSATQRSSQGYTFSPGSGSVIWRSTHSSLVLSSSCEAEIYAGAMAAQELRWLTYLLTDLGEQPRSPPVLYVDNKAMIALCQEHRLEHGTKHIALRYFLARELQQRGQLRRAYVATRANTADIFTKALPYLRSTHDA
ncbi:unnamed protein product [Closterium sp. NIES-54]